MIPHKFIWWKVSIKISFLSESFSLLGSKILVPGPTVVPVALLKFIFFIFANPQTVLLAISNKLSTVIGIISSILPADAEISRTHFDFFICDIERIIWRSSMLWVLILCHWCFIGGFYREFKVKYLYLRSLPRPKLVCLKIRAIVRLLLD